MSDSGAAALLGCHVDSDAALTCSPSPADCRCSDIGLEKAVVSDSEDAVGRAWVSEEGKAGPAVSGSCNRASDSELSVGLARVSGGSDAEPAVSGSCTRVS
jgi:hypothetical protein